MSYRQRTRTNLSIFTVTSATQTVALLSGAAAGNVALDLTKLRNGADPSFKIFLMINVLVQAGNQGTVTLTANGTTVDTYNFTNTTAATVRRDITAALASYTGIVVMGIQLARTSGLGSATLNLAQVEVELEGPDA